MNAVTAITAPRETSVLSVPGAHCAGCMSKIERGLAALDSVESARVNLTSRSVTVVHDPALDEQTLVQELAKIGFESKRRPRAAEKPFSAIKPLLGPLAVSAFAAMNIMLISVSVWSGADGATREMFHWISALIALPAVAYAGQPFFKSAWGALKHGRTNMDVPISIGVIIACCLSLYEVIVGGEHAWFDSALMLLAFLLAGRVLDAMMRDRARSAVDSLLGQAADGALVIRDDTAPEWVTADELQPGMVMRIAAGERLAADGEIISGQSRFDQSLLTGEAKPVACQQGSAVLAGTLNLDSPVDVEVSHTGRDTTLAEIARLMEASTQNRSRYVRIADRAARLYAPAVHTLAATAVIGWLVAGASLYEALVIGVAVLIITCPCALGLAVPVAQVVASGSLLRAGIMVKDGSALERLAGVNRALFDKTGTLTLGRPVPERATLDGLSDEHAAIALGLASHSRHPISRALSQALIARGVTSAEIASVSEDPGIGVSGMWNGNRVALRRPEGASSMGVALEIEGYPARLITFADRLRDDAREAMDEMGRLGISSSILSGDNVDAVAQVARQTGLMGQAGASPVDKQQAIARLQQAGSRVLMVGDGLNDGPALAAADASMAPGNASDVGMQAADFVFVRETLGSVPRAIRASRATMRVVKQNFALAIAYNVFAVPLALFGFVTPLMAALAMSLSSLIVVGNSLRLVRAAK